MNELRDREEPVRQVVHSYLIRFWHSESSTAGEETWRFTVQDPLNGRRRGFTTFCALVHYLHTEMMDPNSNCCD